MKIKTVEARSSEELDRMVNEFEENNNVKATQTHFQIYDGVKYFVAVMFYEKQNTTQKSGGYTPDYGDENQPRDKLVSNGKKESFPLPLKDKKVETIGDDL